MIKLDFTLASPFEHKLARAFATTLGVAEVGAHQDFFVDLGGHSLLAAQLTSALRYDPQCSALSIRDLYDHPTPARLAKHLARTKPCTIESAQPETADTHSTLGWAPVAQAVGLYFVSGFHSSQWLAPYLTFIGLRDAHWASTPAVLAALAVLLAVNPAMLLLALAAKWLVIGRYRVGAHRLWSAYYVRHWFVDRLLALAPLERLQGTPLLNVYLRLLGARIGNNVLIATRNITAFDLVQIDDDSAIGVDSRVSPSTVEGGQLTLRPIVVGARCVVGARAVLTGGACLDDDSELFDLSRLADGQRLPAGEKWSGSPAKCHSRVVKTAISRPALLTRIISLMGYSAAAFALPLFALVALVPGLLLLQWLEQRHGALHLLAAPLVALVFVVMMCLEIAIFKRCVVGRIEPGKTAIWGLTYARKWIFDQAMRLSLDLVGGLYATLYLRPFYALLGVKMGKNAEVSTASDLDPDLLEIGDGAFVADCVSLGAARLGRGVMELQRTVVGPRAFVGNSAVIPSGTTLGPDSLVGCLSIAPAHDAAAGSSWLGSPPIELPNRQASTSFAAQTTYRPTRGLVVQRLAIELVRVLGPNTGLVVFASLITTTASFLLGRMSVLALILAFPPIYLAFSLVAALIVIALKWLVVGRYRVGERPLWHSFVWRTELVTALTENLADPLLNEMLIGTPLLACFFRAMGANIGRGVYMATTQLTEYDLVSVGDNACLDTDCTLQTHLFEDRVMKMSTVTIGDRCSVGADSVVLYGTTMAAGSCLTPLSLLMKGEALPPETRWAGIPAAACAGQVAERLFPAKVLPFATLASKAA